MFQNTNNSRGFETTLVSEVVPSAPTRRSLSALLAQSALQNTGSIAAMATRLSSIAPMGSEHYQAIVDAYARNAAVQIERW